MRRKLWPKAAAKGGTLGQMLKNFQVYFILIFFLKKPNKKIYNRAKELYYDDTLFVFWFFIVYLPKKNESTKMKIQNKNRKTMTTTPMYKARHSDEDGGSKTVIKKALPPKTKTLRAFFVMDPQNPAHATKIGYNVQNIYCGLT